MNKKKSEELKKRVLVAVRMTERQRNVLRRLVYSNRPRITLSRYIRKVLGVAMKGGMDAIRAECAKEWQEDEYALDLEETMQKGKKGDKNDDKQRG